MDLMTDMMQAMSKSDMAAGMDMGMMQECIEACSAAAMAATMCADSDGASGMGRCCSMCANTADVATTMMRMMLRPTGYDANVMQSMMMATVAMGEACAAECRMHAQMDDDCRICAMACDAMVDACRRAMAGMAA